LTDTNFVYVYYIVIRQRDVTHKVSYYLPKDPVQTTALASLLHWCAAWLSIDTLCASLAHKERTWN